MLGKLKQVSDNMSDKDKLELFVIASLALLCTTVVLFGVARSRESDAVYFKERLIMLEERFNIAEKGRNDINLRLSEHDNKLHAQGVAIVGLQSRVTEAEQWLDDIKRLPQIPKPKGVTGPPPLPKNQ